MEIQKNMDLYSKYWKIRETLPELEDGKMTSRGDFIALIKDLRKNQPQILQRLYSNQFQYSKEANTVIDGQPQFTCKILQWNILAQGLALGKDNFVLCPKSSLHWDYRKLLILEEIMNSEADIFCLEEVDKFWFLKNTLNSVGYEGLFFPKPDSPALYSDESSGPDGCAIFYDKSKLKLLKHDLINLHTLDGKKTNQVCIVGLFCSVNSPNIQFCVATVHLKAKPGWHELRFSQGAYLLKYLEENYSNLPLVVCGDFNAASSEPVYTAFKDSNLKLQSIYTLLSEGGEEPPYTTWKTRGGPSGNVETCKTIDYMWISKDKIQVKSLYSIPGPDAVDENRLPSCRYPSDHFSLAAEITVSNKFP